MSNTGWHYKLRAKMINDGLVQYDDYYILYGTT